MASPITQAIRAICDEKLLTEDAVLEAVQSALAAAYRKDFGNKNQNIKCELDPEKYDGETAGIRIFDVKEVVEDMELPEDYFERFEETHIAGKREEGRWKGEEVKGKDDRRDVSGGASSEKASPSAEATGDEVEKDEFVFNPKTMIMLSDARDLKPDAQIGDEIRVELNIPAAFGRMAAQTAKQVIMQKLREAERGVIYQDFKEREGELMNVTIQRREGRVVLIDLGRATGIILPEDQIEGERYFAGSRIKAILREVALTNRGPEIRLSRSSPGLVAALFAQEIPEVANGTVEIRDIAREAGSRTKVAVTTSDDMIDPIGSCIGQRGTRIQTIIRELGGEKVDVILWNEDEGQYISNALSPAKVISVGLDRAQQLATVHVSPDQLSLAIGKGGQNVRLAAKLTSWKITVMTPEGEIAADSDAGDLSDVSAKTDQPADSAENPFHSDGEEGTEVVSDSAETAEAEKNDAVEKETVEAEEIPVTKEDENRRDVSDGASQSEIPAMSDFEDKKTE